MKKWLIGLALLAVLCGSAVAKDWTISTMQTSVTVAASGTVYSNPLSLTGKHGYFSTQVVVGGSGTVTVSYQLSNSDVAPQIWSTPVGASAIASGLTAGTYLYKFEPHTIAKWLRLSFTETGTSNAVTVISNLAGQ